MELELIRLNLPLEHPFTIARGTINTQPSLVVALHHDGIVGLGEVTENDYYGHTYGSITRSLEKVNLILDQYASQSPFQLWQAMYDKIEGDTFALSALDMAAHDWHGKRIGKPTWQHWGLQIDDGVPSSFTIGIDTIPKMIAKLNQRPGWPIYKIKLGASQDIEIITELRKHTDAVFRVDANCGWTRDQTVENSILLNQLGVEFIEQPLPTHAPNHDKRFVFENSALPIIADEDCQVPSDVAKCHSLYHGINVKICKCGGLSPAMNMLRQARQLGMKTMVGCMVESSIGISGAAQLLPLLDYADLDGALLLKSEPASGVTIDQGKVCFSAAAGTGAVLHSQRVANYQP